MRGNRAGLLMAALAMSAMTAPSLAEFEVRTRRRVPDTREGPINPDTVNTGRRAEKVAAAIAKAEAKRARKAARRAKDASYNAESKSAERSTHRDQARAALGAT